MAILAFLLTIFFKRSHVRPQLLYCSGITVTSKMTLNGYFAISHFWVKIATMQQVSQYWYSGNASMGEKYKIYCHFTNFIKDWQTVSSVTQQRKH